MEALLPYVEWDRFITLAGSKSGLSVTLSYLTKNRRNIYVDRYRIYQDQQFIQ